MLSTNVKTEFVIPAEAEIQLSIRALLAAAVAAVTGTAGLAQGQCNYSVQQIVGMTDQYG